MVGKTVGKYRVVERIGRGGMGIVYKAVDETLDREVAVKVLNPDLSEAEVVKRFRAEAMTLARLNHPGIATIYELVRTEDDLLMVMEFVRGETFDRIVERGGPLPIARATSLGAQVLDALGHAHRVGIVHRDLKPANLMLTEYGSTKIMDFGIARVLGTEHLTSDGLMMGTPAYMAPEQVMAADVDARADLYSIGVVLYRLLSGNLPFKADTAIAMAHKQLKDPPTPLRQYRAELPPWCEDLLSRALAKSPADRFQTAEEFRDALVGRGASLVPVAAPAPQLETTLPPGRVAAIEPAAAPAAAPPGEPTYDSTIPVPTPSGVSVALPHSASAQPSSTPVASGQPAQAATPSSIGPTTLILRRRHLAIAVGLFGLLAVAAAGLALIVIRRPATPAAAPTAVTMPPAPSEGSVPNQPSGGAGLPPSREASAAAPPPAPARDRPTPPRAADRKPVAAPPPAAPSATPPAARDAALPPLTLTDLRIINQDGERLREREATATFADGILTLSVKDGPVVRSIPYDQILSVHYSRARQPMWQTPGGPAPVMRVRGGAFGMFRSEPHWLAIRTKEVFLVLRLGPEHLRSVPAAFSDRAGVQLTTVRASAR